MSGTEIEAVTETGEIVVEIIVTDIEFHHKSDRTHRLHVRIVNENDGDEFLLRAGRQTLISTLITKMYHKLGLTHHASDRLRCECSGEDVFQFAVLKIGDYLHQGHCPDLTWTFVTDTGGA